MRTRENIVPSSSQLYVCTHIYTYVYASRVRRAVRELGEHHLRVTLLQFGRFGPGPPRNLLYDFNDNG